MSSMKPASLKKEIIERINLLPSELQQKVLEFIDSLTQKLPKGTPGKQLLRFAGCISRKDLKSMTDAIAEGCERVDVREW